MIVDANDLIAIAVSERPMVFARVKRYVGEQYAEDVTQNTYERAVLLLREGRLVVEEGPHVRGVVRAWLTAVAFRMVVNFLRSKDERMIPTGKADAETFATPDPVPQLEAREAVRQALYRVNRREREVLAGVANGNLLREIADALGILPDVNYIHPSATITSPHPSLSGFSLLSTNVTRITTLVSITARSGFMRQAPLATHSHPHSLPPRRIWHAWCEEHLLGSRSPKALPRQAWL